MAPFNETCVPRESILSLGIQTIKASEQSAVSELLGEQKEPYLLPSLILGSVHFVCG
jgi:hypothetical protein